MNKPRPGGVEELIWEEIARDLAREEGIEKCLCYPESFRGYLHSRGLPFGLEGYPGPGGAPETVDLFLGWPVLKEGSALLSPEEIWGVLKPGGEARIFGFYSAPRPDDLREWEASAGEAGSSDLPPAGAVSLGEAAGWLKTGPFERYTIRKRGIYYDCRLVKDS